MASSSITSRWDRSIGRDLVVRYDWARRLDSITAASRRGKDVAPRRYGMQFAVFAIIDAGRGCSCGVVQRRRMRPMMPVTHLVDREKENVWNVVLTFS